MILLVEKKEINEINKFDLKFRWFIQSPLMSGQEGVQIFRDRYACQQESCHEFPNFQA